jgi:hypothetical protein
MKICREDGRVNPWKNSKVRLPLRNLLRQTIILRRLSANVRDRRWNFSGSGFCRSAPQARTGERRLRMRWPISKRGSRSWAGRSTCRPAGRAPYAGGDHFVICIPPSGRGSRWSPERIFLADHREARAKPVYPPRSGRRPRRAPGRQAISSLSTAPAPTAASATHAESSGSNKSPPASATAQSKP